MFRTTHVFGARISWANPDPLLGWRNAPGFQYWHNKENNHPITGRFNNFGWRDKDWVLEKPHNIFRIALLGDSYVEAIQVEQDKTFFSKTERTLNSSHKRKVQLMNFGQSGFTQTEELIILRNDVLRFSPDMVILFFLPDNDIKDVRKETASESLRPFYHLDQKGKLVLDTSFSRTLPFKIKEFINPLKQHSALISLITERYNCYKQQKHKKTYISKKTPPQVKLPGSSSLATDSPEPAYVENYDLNKLLIKKMVDICNEKGIRFMLVVLDVKTYMPEVEKEYKLIDPSFNSNFFEDDLEKFAHALSIDFLGLQRTFREHYIATGKPLHWGHWNYEGHKVVANALTEKLEAVLFSDGH